jgi:hypothetical protein
MEKEGNKERNEERTSTLVRKEKLMFSRKII